MLSFMLSEGAPTKLSIHDLRGSLIRVVVNRTLSAGEYVFGWDGRGDDGRQMQTGIYFVRLVSGDEQQTRKIMLLK